MLIKYKNLTIRNAVAADAEQLCAWWNDGKIMAHAGLPNGSGETTEEIRDRLIGNTDDTHGRHIIELDGKPIGEMMYRNKGGAAELGIKICDFSKQEKGYGTELLTIFIDALFRY
jgi:RimJ/RimL family protein N-acetyltransferase